MLNKLANLTRKLEDGISDEFFVVSASAKDKDAAEISPKVSAAMEGGGGSHEETDCDGV